MKDFLWNFRCSRAVVSFLVELKEWSWHKDDDLFSSCFIQVLGEESEHQRFACASGQLDEGAVVGLGGADQQEHDSELCGPGHHPEL